MVELLVFCSRTRRGSSYVSSTVFLAVISTLVLQFRVISAVPEPMKISNLVAEVVTQFIKKLQTSDDVEDGASFPQTRGGYGHGHGHNHGAITLDPVSIISLLALGAFLINNILQLLRANMNNNNNNNQGGGNGGNNPQNPNGYRSLSLDNLDSFPFSLASSSGFNQSDEPSFIDFFENVGSLYYLQPKKRHMCMKRVVCNYIGQKESREKSTHLKTKIFDFMVSTVTKIVAPEIDQEDKDEKCLKTQKFCSDALLQDARVSVEYKIYSQVSSWLTKLAFSGLTSG